MAPEQSILRNKDLMIHDLKCVSAEVQVGVLRQSRLAALERCRQELDEIKSIAKIVGVPKLSLFEIREIVTNGKNLVPEKSVWRHRKNKELYNIQLLAWEKETHRVTIIYSKDDVTFSHPLTDFVMEFEPWS